MLEIWVMYSCRQSLMTCIHVCDIFRCTVRRGRMKDMKNIAHPDGEKEIELLVLLWLKVHYNETTDLSQFKWQLMCCLPHNVRIRTLFFSKRRRKNPTNWTQVWFEKRGKWGMDRLPNRKNISGVETWNLIEAALLAGGLLSRCWYSEAFPCLFPTII